MALYAKSERVAGSVQSIDNPVEFVAGIAPDMQNRSENLGADIGHTPYFDQGWRHEMAIQGLGLQIWLPDTITRSSHTIDMVFDTGSGGSRDNRSYIAFQLIRGAYMACADG